METIENKILEKHNILERLEGKLVTKGKFARQIFNQKWRVQNKETNEIYYIMLCGKNTLTYIDEESIQKVSEHKNAWIYNKNVFYVQSGDENRSLIYLHAFLMNHSGNGKGGDSVDHLNRKKLDNRLCNLKIKTCGENTANIGKKIQKNAIPLPKPFESTILPKHCSYKPDNYSINEIKELKEFKNLSDETLQNLKILKREFFYIENHPDMPLNLSGKKYWATTKSKKISIIEKYNDLMKKIESIDPYYMNDMISTEELHKEFFIISNDNSDNIINSEKNIKNNDLADIVNNNKKKVNKDNIKEVINNKLIIEILQLKERCRKNENFDNGIKITRLSICKYYKDNNILLNLTVNKIDRIRNRLLLKESDFENEDLKISYVDYNNLVQMKLKNLII